MKLLHLMQKLFESYIASIRSFVKKPQNNATFDIFKTLISSFQTQHCQVFSDQSFDTKTVVMNDILSKLINDKVLYQEKLDLLHQLQDLSSSIKLTAKDAIATEFISSMVYCLSAPTVTIKAAALRTLRVFISEPTLLCELFKQNGHYFIVMAMELNKGENTERIYAFKFIRHCITIDCTIIPRAIVQSLVAISKFQDDPCYRISLQTLVELAIQNPELVHNSNGISVIFHSIIDFKPFNENFQDALIAAVTYLLTTSSKRQYVQPGDIRILIEPFTNTYESSEEVRKTRVHAAQQAVPKFLRSWTGLICFVNDECALPALVASLQLPDLKLSNILLDLLFKIFHIPIPIPNQDPFTQRSLMLEDDDDKDMPTKTLAFRHNLLEDYLTMLLLAFNEAQLLENLLLLCSKMNAKLTSNEGDECRAIAIKATCLIGDILHLSNMLLPPSKCARLQALPQLVNSAITFTQDPRLRSLSSTMAANLQVYSIMKRADEIRGSIGLDYSDEVKKKLDWKMDDALLRQKLNDSVLLKKDSSSWNWDIISELVEGPLYNPVHFDSQLSQRFVKKILAFMKPSSKIFGSIPYSIVNKKKIGRTCCQLLKVMLAHNSGRALLTQNEFLPELAELLDNEVKFGIKGGELNQERLLRSMTKEYFTMLGTLSSSAAGRDILNRHKIYEVLFPISVMKGRDDLSNLVIKSLDYNMQGPSRMLLAKSLNADSVIVKYVAIRQIEALFGRVPDFSDWCVQLLVQKLKDPDTKVSSTAVRILTEATEDYQCTESMIAKKPYDALRCDPAGKKLLMRFLSRPSGFEYLSSTPFVQEELKQWKEGKEYIEYVKKIESALTGAFSAPVWKQTGVESFVDIPVHFYGELARTPAGIKLMKENGDYNWFVSLLASPNSTSLEKRGALWAVGHIGSVKFGLKELLLQSDVFSLILSLADGCPCLATRGTCLYVMGMLSKTRSGAKALASYGWEPVREKCIVLPSDLQISNFFVIQDWVMKPTWPAKLTQSELVLPQIAPPTQSSEDVVSEVSKFFSNLSNSILADKAVAALKRLKAGNGEYFQDTNIQYYVFKLMENFSYQLPPRRFMYQIFSTHWKLASLKQLPPCDVIPVISEQEKSIIPQSFKEKTGLLLNKPDRKSMQISTIASESSSRSSRNSSSNWKTEEGPRTSSRALAPFGSRIQRPAN